MLALIFSPSANSQTASSTTQIVIFGVSRSTTPVLNTLASFQSRSTSSKSSETTALQNQLKQLSSKVTVSTSNAVSSDVHLDLLSVLEAKKPVANDRTPLVLTITE
jgi:hypothetical protein